MSLGENIKKYRILNNMEQSELAALLNVSNRTISSWECDRTEPKIIMIQKLCELLGCEQSDLIGSDKATINIDSKKICSSNDRIKELINELEISQTEFCKRTGINKSALSNYLNGDRSPRLDQIAKIADAFNIDPAWLFGYDVPPTLVSDGDLSRLIEIYKDLDSDSQATLLRFARFLMNEED